MAHLHNGILLIYKEEGNLTFPDSPDGPRGYYGKLNKPVRERQVLYDFTYMWNLKNNINEQNGGRIKGTENRLTAVRGCGVGGNWVK